MTHYKSDPLAVDTYGGSDIGSLPRGRCPVTQECGQVFHRCDQSEGHPGLHAAACGDLSIEWRGIPSGRRTEATSTGASDDLVGMVDRWLDGATTTQFRDLWAALARVEADASVAIREAIETEWYNGNVDTKARDRLLKVASPLRSGSTESSGA